MGLFSAVIQKSQQPKGRPGLDALLPPRQTVSACELTVADELDRAAGTLWTRLRRPGATPVPLARQVFAFAHWEPQEGATTVAVALALHAARSLPACTFCLVDCDFFTAGLSKLVELDAAPGLSNVLAGDMPLAGALASTQLSNLWLAPVGHPNVGGRVAEFEDRCRAVCEQLTARFNYLVLDLPPLRDHPPFASWATGLAEAVLVVRAGQARQPAVGQAVRTLQLMRLKLSAVALNAREYYVPSWLYERT